MSKERFSQIIDEVYQKYTTKYMGYEDVPSKDLFLFEIKTIILPNLIITMA